MTESQAYLIAFLLVVLVFWVAVIAGLLRNIAQSQEKIAQAAQDALRTARARTARKD